MGSGVGRSNAASSTDRRSVLLAAIEELQHGFAVAAGIDFVVLVHNFAVFDDEGPTFGRNTPLERVFFSVNFLHDRSTSTGRHAESLGHIAVEIRQQCVVQFIDLFEQSQAGQPIAANAYNLDTFFL